MPFSASATVLASLRFRSVGVSSAAAVFGGGFVGHGLPSDATVRFGNVPDASGVASIEPQCARSEHDRDQQHDRAGGDPQRLDRQFRPGRFAEQRGGRERGERADRRADRGEGRAIGSARLASAKVTNCMPSPKPSTNNAGSAGQLAKEVGRFAPTDRADSRRSRAPSRAADCRRWASSAASAGRPARRQRCRRRRRSRRRAGCGPACRCGRTGSRPASWCGRRRRATARRPGRASARPRADQL